MRDIANQSRREQIASFYADQHARLRRIVRSRVRTGSPELVEDACSYAWMQLLTRHDICADGRGFGWLLAVATHEAWTLDRRGRERRRREQAVAEPEVLLELTGIATRSAEQQALASLDAHDRLAMLGHLRDRDRRALYLFGLGYSYTEIAQLTASTMTAVNRRISEGRARLRALTADQPSDADM